MSTGNVDRLDSRIRLRQWILDWVPVVLWMAGIFFLSSSSDPPRPELGNPALDFILRKLGHLAEYTVLALLLYRALRTRPRVLMLAFLIASLFAATDEWHQSFVPERESAIRDWAIDSVGSAVALAAIAWKRRGRT